MTPVAVGDYYAGPNHILPTNRRARFASPLTAEDFRKVTSILYYTKDRLRRKAAISLNSPKPKNSRPTPGRSRFVLIPRRTCREIRP